MMSEAIDHTKSETGWWIGSYIERFDDPEAPAEEPLFVNENFMLIRAVHFDEAFSKLEQYRDVGNPLSTWRGWKGEWSFAGFSALLPIYEALEDGAELLWREWEGCTNESLAEMAMDRQALYENLTGPRAS
jgi:hypothetical protein